MSEVNVNETSDAAPTSVEDRLTAVEGKVADLESKVAQLTLPNAPAASTPVTPNNPGEATVSPPQNDQLTPDQPGVEPTPPADPPVIPAPAPEPSLAAGAPEPGAQIGTAAESGTAEATGTADGTAVAPDGTVPDTEADPTPAADASEKPLYVVVSDDPAYVVPDGYTPSGLYTPDGKLLYHHDADVAGEPGSGGIDGNVGVYADDTVPAVPATTSAS